MSCKVQAIAIAGPHPANCSEMRIVDYLDGHWTLRFGAYGHISELVASTEDIALLASVLSAMLVENEQEMAAISGDFEYESKMDVHNTEAWLDG